MTPKQKAHQTQELQAFLDKGGAKTFFVMLMMKIAVVTFLQGSFTTLEELRARCTKWSTTRIREK